MRYERKEQFEKVNAFGTGTANTAYAQYFTGDSFLNPLTDPEGGLFAANVTFEPGCRNNSHIAVEVPGENCENEWCEPVSHEEYARL